MAPRLVSLPIRKVTCLEDRALVERRAPVTLQVGANRLRVEGVTPLAVDRTLQAACAPGEVVDARLVRAWRERPKGGLPADASALRRRVHDLERTAGEAQATTTRAEVRMRLLAEAEELALRRAAEDAGFGGFEEDPWRRKVAALRDEVDQAAGALADARVAQHRAQRELRDSQEALRLAEEPEADFGGALELVVESREAGPAELVVGYLVPCALWRPAYRATLSGAGEDERVRLEAEAVVWQHTGEAWLDVELEVSTARPTLGTSPPFLPDDRLVLRDKSAEERRVVEVDLREQAIASLSEGAKAAEVPGVDDGGQTRLLRAPAPCRVPGDGEPHRVPLFVVEAKVRSELLGAPERAPIVARVARFQNPGPNVLLAGPVELVRGSGYVGRSRLGFAAPGEELRLGFGSEDAIRVAREDVEEQETAALTGRRTQKHRVWLRVSNTGGETVRLALEERVPVSEVEEVEVRFDPKKAAPPPALVTKDGIVRFELELPPRGQRTVEYRWELSASSKVAGL